MIDCLQNYLRNLTRFTAFEHWYNLVCIRKPVMTACDIPPICMTLYNVSIDAVIPSTNYTNTLCVMQGFTGFAGFPMRILFPGSENVATATPSLHTGRSTSNNRPYTTNTTSGLYTPPAHRATQASLTPATSSTSASASTSYTPPRTTYASPATYTKTATQNRPAFTPPTAVATTTTSNSASWVQLWLSVAVQCEESLVSLESYTILTGKTSKCDRIFWRGIFWHNLYCVYSNGGHNTCCSLRNWAKFLIFVFLKAVTFAIWLWFSSFCPPLGALTNKLLKFGSMQTQLKGVVCSPCRQLDLFAGSPGTWGLK